MDLTPEQVAELAPDAASAAAGKKLAAAQHWRNVGRTEQVLWGECQGSAVYQVRIQLGDISYKCSCPSRKFPCKHVIGLLLVSTGGVVPVGEPPEWVITWLEKRQASAVRQEAAKSKTEQPVDAEAQAKRVEKRHDRVRAGIGQFELWLKDLVRSGLAGLESAPPKLWEEQAARLVDSQAPGLASRVRRLARVPGSSAQWPRQLLDEIGRLQLAVHAFGRLEMLDAGLDDDLRQFIGWAVAQDELNSGGETVRDTWLVVAQRLDDEERIRAQRSWLIGRQTGRLALVLQFAPQGAAFAEAVVPGTQQEAELVFYPGAYRQRARYGTRHGSPSLLEGSWPSTNGIDVFLDTVAEAVAAQPWLDRFGCLLGGVTPTANGATWYVRDGSGKGLPLAESRPWKLLALSGGHPVDLAGEWDGEALRPLAVRVNQRYHIL